MVDGMYDLLSKSKQIKDFLDIPIVWRFGINFGFGMDGEYDILKHWKKSKEYVTLRNVYPTLKTILEEENAENVDNKIKSAKFVQGHRHKIFDNEQIDKIKILKCKKMSNRQIASIMKCSEKTIRNYLKS